MSYYSHALIVLLCLGTGGSAAFAAQETGEMTVGAVVFDTCDLFAGNLDFGTIENAVPTSATASVTVVCNSSVADPTITLGGGLMYFDGMRSMQSPQVLGNLRTVGSAIATSKTIPYKLGFSEGSNASTTEASEPLFLEDNGDGTWHGSVTVYGQTVSTPRAGVDTYSDTVVVTATYTLSSGL
jgi:spore coat protein U-like protein